MALRKFSRYMKIVTLIIIVSVVVSVVYAGYSYLSIFLNNRKQVLLTINGEKIYKEDYNKEIANITTQINEFYNSNKGKMDEKEYTKLPDKVIKEMALSKLVDKSTYILLANSLKIEVSKTDVNTRLKEIETNVGGADTLALLLAQRGTNLAELKKEIRTGLLYEKTVEKLQQKIKPEDTELEKLYTRFKYAQFEGKEFDEVRDEVEKLYYEQNVPFLLSSAREDLFKSLVMSTKDKEAEEIFNSIRKIEVKVDEYEYTRKDLLAQYLNSFTISEKGYIETLEEEVNNNVKHNIDTLVEKYNVAKGLGVKVLEGLNPINKLLNSMQNYYYHLVDTYNPTSEEMMAMFRFSKARYDTANTVSGEVFGKSYVPSKEDEKKALTLATEIFKTTTKENFEKVAKEFSKDPGSASKGGDLGFANMSSFVAEYAKATLEAKAGDIVGPVKTQFGYHIIYVVAKDEKNPNSIHTKHILIKPEISKETKELAKKEVLEVAEKIKAGKLTWETITQDKSGTYDKFNIREQFTKLEKNKALPHIGYKFEINKEVFDSNVGDIIEKDLEDSFVIIQKTQEIEYKEAKFEDVKDRIRTELGFQHANIEISR